MAEEEEEKEEKASSKKESPSAVALASGKKPVTHLAKEELTIN